MTRSLSAWPGAAGRASSALYGETGGQQSHTSLGPVFAAVAVDPAEQPRILPTRDGAFLRARFRQARGLEPM